MAVMAQAHRRCVAEDEGLLTRLLKLDDHSLAMAAGLIRAGELVAFPTETVYGLGAAALDSKAVARIFAAKERPADNPLIIHIHSLTQLPMLCEATADAELLMTAFWPGPLTILLKKKAVVPAITTAGLDTVAVRMPGHEGALQFLRACEVPVAAPSANRSGRPSPTSARHVWDDMQGRIPLILDGGHAQVGLESTVLDMSGEVPTILRPGAVTPEQVAMVLGQCALSQSLMRPVGQDEAAPSPGMRHRHYAPAGRLTLVRGQPQAVAHSIRVLQEKQPGARILAMEQHLPLYQGLQVDNLGKDAAEAAHQLFHLLRRYDDEGVRQIYSECLPATGLGLAVMNRLARAAEFDIIDAGV